MSPEVPSKVPLKKSQESYEDETLGSIDSWSIVAEVIDRNLWEVCGVRYRVLIEQDEDGVYVVEVPALPGCISQGRTRVDAITNIKEAISAYLESLQAHGDPVPPSISEEVVEVNL